MTAGVTELSVVMETRPTVSPTEQTPSAPANQASRRRDTTPVEVHMHKTLHLTNDNLLQIFKHFGGDQLGCDIFLFNIFLWLSVFFR